MELSGWGRYPRIQAEGRSFDSLAAAAALVAGWPECIAHGGGRSYGDAALAPQVILTRRFARMLHFEPQTGVVRAESGVTIKDLLRVFLPRGWLPPVLPGTKYITLGGAVAADIHGKDHHLAGCFSNYVLSLELMLPDGEVVHVSRDHHPALFHATCGGLGLTGVILSVTFRLKRTPSACIRERRLPCAHLAELLWHTEENRQVPYSVAWVDALARGPSLGRGLLILGEPALPGVFQVPEGRSWSCPIDLPDFTLNRFSLAFFNRLYYRRAVFGPRERLVPLEAFFFPLDRLGHWNRLYGRRGLLQYHVVLPREGSPEGLRALLERVSAYGSGPALAVLKLCGPANNNPLSFPREGYSLALDFKRQPQLFRLLTDLDRIVLEHGGRHYLVKDARLSPGVVWQSYPRLAEFVRLREQLGLRRKFTSLLSRRLEL